MPYEVRQYQLEELKIPNAPENEILLITHRDCELHIEEQSHRTIISFPFGNEFRVENGRVIIEHELKK